MVAFNNEEMKPENRMARICEFFHEHMDKVIQGLENHDSAWTFLVVHHEAMHINPETIDFVICETIISYLEDRTADDEMQRYVDSLNGGVKQ